MNYPSFRRRFMLTVVLLSLALGAVLPGPVLAQTGTDLDSLEPNDFIAIDSGPMKTVAVVAVSSYSELISDIGFVGSLGDRPELGQMLEGMVAMFTQGKGLVSIDKTKPWGVILQTDGMQFLPVVCLPVTDFDGLLGLAQGFGMPIADGDNGVKEISMPDGKTLYVKHDGGWAFAAQSPGSLAQLPGSPEATLGVLVEEYDLGARVLVQNVPDMYRQMAMGAMKAGMQDGLQRDAGEDDETYEVRREMTEKQIEKFERVVNEIDNLTIGWAIDAQQQRTYLDVTYGFVPGSKMAEQFASYGQSHTNFAGFFQPDAAMTMSFAMQTDSELLREDVDEMETVMQALRKQLEKGIDEDADIPNEAAREAFKSAIGDFLDAAQATIKTGQMDGGVAVHLQPGSMTLVAGMQVAEPAKIESGLKKFASITESEPDLPGVQWNAASHAGVNFHTLTAPLPEDEEARQMLGDQIDIAIGIGSNAVYVAIGRDNLSAVNQAIDASRADANKEVPLAELSMSLGQIIQMAAASADNDEDRETAETIADMLNNQAQGRDHIRMTGRLIENGLRYRFEAEEGVLRAIGKAAAAEQNKVQQGL